jgi:hypothetical protein
MIRGCSRGAMLGFHAHAAVEALSMRLRSSGSANSPRGIDYQF